jgi:exonuclease VII small subunit
MNMNSDENKISLEKSVQYAYRRLRTLVFEVQLLAIEQKGLYEISSSLADYNKGILTPSTENELLYDDVVFKWSEQAMRYYTSGEAVTKILAKKVKQFQSTLKVLKSDLEDLDIDTSKIGVLLGSADSADSKTLSNIISAFEDINHAIEPVVNKLEN